MRSLVIILLGFGLWVFCLGVLRLIVKSKQLSISIATFVFVLTWLVIASLNLWFGVFHADYSFGEELPIFLLIFLPPAVVAILANIKSYKREKVDIDGKE